jgi:hypothetical protein
VAPSQFPALNYKIYLRPRLRCFDWRCANNPPRGMVFRVGRCIEQCIFPDELNGFARIGAGQTPYWDVFRLMAFVMSGQPIPRGLSRLHPCIRQWRPIRLLRPVQHIEARDLQLVRDESWQYCRSYHWHKDDGL